MLDTIKSIDVTISIVRVMECMRTQTGPRAYSLIRGILGWGRGGEGGGGGGWWVEGDKCLWKRAHITNCNNSQDRHLSPLASEISIA